MRRKDLEITDSNVLKNILSKAKYVTLALAMNNQPYLVSLSHGYDESRNCIYFHCANKGKKIDFLKSNNLVWGQALFDARYREDECDHFFAQFTFEEKSLCWKSWRTSVKPLNS
jgi:nitroimidazol reductase NimA-like FMN-containing flavoprotein (pyridoxamine 5'-phosphate oxidase superfamily)